MITTLRISHFRNLNHVDIQPSQCNIVIGKNGSGKTSLLESIFLLSRGKSFRTHQPKKYIQHQQLATTVFSRFEHDISLAIQKHSDATTLLKLNGDMVKTQSEITRLIPMLLIDPSSMEVLEQGSASRRQLLDWLAFHVKHDFYRQWLAYQKILKQRNRLLKQINILSNSHRQQVQAWDDSLAVHAHLIHTYRQQIFDEWCIHFNNCIEKLLPKYAGQLRMSYQIGYDITQKLQDILANRLIQDVQQGYTRVGCHRADIHIHWQEPPPHTDSDNQRQIKDLAINILSRGEKKLLITALKLSQLSLLHTYVQHNHAQLSDEQSHLNINHVVNTTTPVVLLDDVTAELDGTAVDVLIKTLSGIHCQLFITSLSDDVLVMIDKYWQNYKVFHVKQGILIEKS